MHYINPPDSLIKIYSTIYKEGIINIFAFTSAWLTVITAISRYIVVCKPLHARRFISLKMTSLFVVLVFVVSPFVNLIRFLKIGVETIDCVEDLKFNENPQPEEDTSDDSANDTFSLGLTANYNLTIAGGSEEMFTGNLTDIDYYESFWRVSSTPSDYSRYSNCDCTAYSQKIISAYYDSSFNFPYYPYLWFIFCTVTPILILSVCNICLINALRRSRRIQVQHRANGKQGKQQDSAYILTLTLIILIVMHILLVTPSNLLILFQEVILKSSNDMKRYIIITNLLLLTNFSANFILYCVVSRYFRRVAMDIFCCRCVGKWLSRIRRQGWAACSCSEDETARKGDSPKTTTLLMGKSTPSFCPLKTINNNNNYNNNNKGTLDPSSHSSGNDDSRSRLRGLNCALGSTEVEELSEI